MEEKKVVAQYVVVRYEDGSTDVKNDESVEGTAKLSAEEIYKDIEAVAELIKYRRIENAAYAGVNKFYAEIQAAQARAEAEQAKEEAAPAEPTLS